VIASDVSRKPYCLHTQGKQDDTLVFQNVARSYPKNKPNIIVDLHFRAKNCVTSLDIWHTNWSMCYFCLIINTLLKRVTCAEFLKSHPKVSRGAAEREITHLFQRQMSGIIRYIM
jgi:hypothetical protein